MKTQDLLGKSVYPSQVDFNYTVRCDKHNFKPYDYCEMCFIRSELQKVREEAKKDVRSSLSNMQLCISVIHDMLDDHKKKIDELQILVKLLEVKQ